MRGKPAAFCSRIAGLRITPADAGKTVAVAGTFLRKTDHPRGCGENSQLSVRASTRPGSPPRMRGKQVFVHAGQPVQGITPADAGKTRGYRPRRRPRQDHPRGCGENFNGVCSCNRCWGSPPRMRGKRRFPPVFRGSQRITPADAGKTKPLAASHA